MRDREAVGGGPVQRALAWCGGWRCVQAQGPAGHLWVLVLG